MMPPHLFQCCFQRGKRALGKRGQVFPPCVEIRISLTTNCLKYFLLKRDTVARLQSALADKYKTSIYNQYLQSNFKTSIYSFFIAKFQNAPNSLSFSFIYFLFILLYHFSSFSFLFFFFVFSGHYQRIFSFQDVFRGCALSYRLHTAHFTFLTSSRLLTARSACLNTKHFRRQLIQSLTYLQHYIFSLRVRRAQKTVICSACFIASGFKTLIAICFIQKFPPKILKLCLFCQFTNTGRQCIIYVCLRALKKLMNLRRTSP